MSLLLKLLDVAPEEPTTGLHGRPVRERRRGRVGVLDAKWRKELEEAEAERQAALVREAQLAARITEAAAEQDRAISRNLERLQAEAAARDARITARIEELKANIAAAIEADRIAAFEAEQLARRIDEDDAISVLLAF